MPRRIKSSFLALVYCLDPTIVRNNDHLERALSSSSRYHFYHHLNRIHDLYKVSRNLRQTAFPQVLHSNMVLAYVECRESRNLRVFLHAEARSLMRSAHIRSCSDRDSPRALQSLDLESSGVMVTSDWNHGGNCRLDKKFDEKLGLAVSEQLDVFDHAPPL
jgi:hypothetical protein